MSWTSARKEKRMTEVSGEIISDQKYNLFLGGTVFYGLLVNIILCAVAGETMLDWVLQSNANAAILGIGYLILAVIGIVISRKSTNPAISFIGYNMIVVPMGLLVSVYVSAYLSAGMGDVVFQAIVITAVTTFAMIHRGNDLCHDRTFLCIPELLLEDRRYPLCRSDRTDRR